MSSTEIFLRFSRPIYHHRALPLLHLTYFVRLINFKKYSFF